MKKILTLLAIALATLTSCKEELVQYSISVDPVELSFNSVGGEDTVYVTSSTEWELFSENDYWCYVSSYSGNGDAEIVITAEPNEDSKSGRTATFTFVSGDKEATLIVKQEKEYLISIEPTELTFGAEGGEQVITITSSDKWTLDQSDAWYSASSYTGNNENEIVIEVEPYDNTEESREVDLVFLCGDKKATLNIKQFPDEIIEFKDSNFLHALLESNRRIDKNGDAKISKSEASVQKSLFVGKSNINNIDEIKYFISLEELYCYENQLTSLDVSSNLSLKVLYCQYNQLTKLDLSRNMALIELNCVGNQLTSLDLSNNPAITTVSCEDNQLLTINLSKNTALTSLNCKNNRLSFLDISNNQSLNVLCCYSNRITELDLSQCHELEYVECCQFSYSIEGSNYQFYPDYSTRLPLKSLKIYKYHTINAPFIIALETFYQGIIEYVD